MMSRPSCTLKITGTLGAELDEQRLAAEVRNAVAEGAAVVYLDLADVSFVDSAGLGSLIRCNAICSEADASWKLFNVPKQLHNLLTLARLDTIMEILAAPPAPGAG